MNASGQHVGIKAACEHALRCPRCRSPAHSKVTVACGNAPHNAPRRTRALWHMWNIVIDELTVAEHCTRGAALIPLHDNEVHHITSIPPTVVLLEHGKHSSCDETCKQNCKPPYFITPIDMREGTAHHVSKSGASAVRQMVP